MYFKMKVFGLTPGINSYSCIIDTVDPISYSLEDLSPYHARIPIVLDQMKWNEMGQAINANAGESSYGYMWMTIIEKIGGSIDKICITDIKEGVFKAHAIIGVDNMDNVKVPLNADDALILHLMSKLPIYVHKDVIKMSAVFIDIDEQEVSYKDVFSTELHEDDEFINIHNEEPIEEEESKESLTKKLEEAISNEDYELAANIQKKINEYDS